MPTKRQLKQQANALFRGPLLTSVLAKIERKAEAAPASGSDLTRTQSIATLFAGDRLYNRLGVGKFSGRLNLVWNGVDSFVFIPDQHDPFSYTTSADFKYPNWTIQPRLMDTDGGSIPRAARGFWNFSSWGYAPAYIIHDWLFTAHKCGFEPDHDWEFDDTAEVLAEAIKTLMVDGFTNYDGRQVVLPKAEDTLYIIYQAVASRIARRVYDNFTSVVCRQPPGS